jgi:hypothetical protein
LVKALACQIGAKFLKEVASSIVDKYIGDSARVIRKIFAGLKRIILRNIYRRDRCNWRKEVVRRIKCR